MDWSPDNRAVAVPLAATLALGFIILAMAIYQVTVVPAETAEIEYEHSTTVGGQFVGVSDAIHATASEGVTTPSTVSLGANYPFRTVFVGPGDSGGTLQTAPLGTVTLQNVSYTDGNEVDRNYTTAGIQYEPTYSQYDVGAETWLEHGIAVRRTATGSGVGLSEQRLVDGSQLSLTLLDGTLSTAASGRTTVPIRPVSVDETTVEVTQNDSGSPTLVASTRLDESTWNRLLAAEKAPRGNITAVSVTETAGSELNELRVELANGSYDLTVANIAVGSGVEELEPAYLFAVTQEQTVRDGSVIPVSVEVRDRYDNRISGVRVEFSDSSGNTVLRSNENGVATYEYDATEPGTVEMSVVATSISTEIEFTVV